MTDDVFNAADEEQVEAREKKVKSQREQELEDISKILETRHGVRFFKRLMEKGSIFSTTYTGNSKTFFLEGGRNLVLSIFNDVCEICPDKVPDLMINKKGEN